MIPYCLRRIFFILFVLLNSPNLLFSQSISFKPIHGGRSYAEAVALASGQDLQLDHHQRRGEYDYFSFDISGGQSLTISLSVGDHGVELKPEGAVETALPQAALFVYDTAGNRLGQISFSGEKNLRKMLQIDAMVPQKIYVVVGSPVQDMHKDYVGFRLDTENYFDADGLGEAGATLEASLPLERGRRYVQNSLTRNDEVDFFRIPTVPGENISVDILPQNPKSVLSAAIYDEARAELTRGRSEPAGAPISLNARATTSQAFLKVSRDLTSEATSYLLALSAKAATETVPLGETAPTILPSPPILPETMVVPAETAPTLEEPTPSPTAGLTQQVERQQKEIEDLNARLREARNVKPKPVAFSWKKLNWLDPKVLTFVGILLFVGLLLGVLLGIRLGKKLTKRYVPLKHTLEDEEEKTPPPGIV